MRKFKIWNFFGEAILVFALIFSINNYFSNESNLIQADGQGYYDYLPAAFIYGDLPSVKKVQQSERIEALGMYISYQGHKLDKYPCGTAVLLFPFFTYAHLSAPLKGYKNDGYSLPYQKAVYYGALIYLFFGLYFLRRFLSFYTHSKVTIFLIQLLVVFSTSVIHYVHYDPAFSHVYSFFAISAFLYYTKAYFSWQQKRHFLALCLFFGLIILLRQINVLIIFFIPFLAGSFEELKAKIQSLFKQWTLLIQGVLIVTAIFSLQLFAWHHQTGHWFVFSYQGESFDFLNPEFFKILFSYQKGLYVYTPVFFIANIGLFLFIMKRQYFSVVSWLFFFLLLTYVLSAWWSWYYGCSYGLRAYIDFYPVFCVLLVPIFDHRNIYFKSVIGILLFLTIPLNMIQTLQYKKYILHWDRMNKEKYWSVFLRTDQMYGGLVWKKEFRFAENPPQVIYTTASKQILLPAGKVDVLYKMESNTVPEYDKVNIIQVSFKNDFDADAHTFIELSIIKEGNKEVSYKFEIPLIHYYEQKLNTYHQGLFNYEVPALAADDRVVRVTVRTTEKEAKLDDFQVKFLHYNY